MSANEKLDTHQKALTINLDSTTFGSFAEIGAGQEVVRWFLVVGGASGTVAKSISAYDKEVSDDLYGSGARYVSKERLDAMLDSEWVQLLAQLAKTRGSNTRFFAFVDTMSASNYARTNDPHGWVGMRFQLQPGGEPNDILLHINLRDPSNLLQQEAIGILGVNLIYSAFYHLEKKEILFEDVIQGVEKRIEIDHVCLRGPAFEMWEQRGLVIHLVRAGLAEAVCFSSSGSPVPPSEALYKKAVVLAPGSFARVDADRAQIHKRMVATGIDHLRDELDERASSPVGFFCLSAMPLTASEPRPAISDLLKRIDALLASGFGVLLFRERELYTMIDLVNRYTAEHVRFVVGLSLLIRVFEDRYSRLDGSFLEALSRLFAQNVRIYAYPMTSKALQESIQRVGSAGWEWLENEGWVSAAHLRLAPPVGHLYDYVLASKFLVPIEIPAAQTA